MNRTEVQVSVRAMAEFVLRAGDLGGSGHFTTRDRALEGTRGHQRLQKSRPPGYEAEVVIKRVIDAGDFSLRIDGRIDGVERGLTSVLIEEIKTTQRPWTGAVDPLHLAQAKIYACIYAQDHGMAECEVQVTYLDLPSGATVVFREAHSLAELGCFFEAVTGAYLEWIRAHRNWCGERDASIAPLAFPYGQYRPGQRDLAVGVYRAIKNRAKLFVEAPTGIGKTVSALFPAIKALGEGKAEKLFYLTAKTVGRTVAEMTLADLRARGLKLRAITLTAKDKICFKTAETCDLKSCPFAIGYYDRIKDALRALLRHDALTREQIESMAREHQVCPFELSLDAAPWCDAIICDYNYAFDPTASLKRFFDGEQHEYAILIDEAHNLVDRAREMFSAELSRLELLELKRELKEMLPEISSALGTMATKLKSLIKEEGWTEREGVLSRQGPPEKLDSALERFLDSAEAWLAREEPAGFRPALLDIYFGVISFQRVLELYDERYATIYDGRAERLRLFCVDPSSLLRKAVERTGATVFFSATLSPLEYFREALGGQPLDALLRLTSPFPAEHLGVVVHSGIATRMRSRAKSYDAVVEAIGGVVNARPGNYLVYFPSYEYLTEVLQRFRAAFPKLAAEAQKQGMSEEERASFLARFREEQSHVAFAVLGGIFGEGIDLVGERLIGVVVAGVGLPQVCTERELIREHCDRLNRPGFEYAYTFPGMNRVLQAAGRVIRSERDRGVVVLLDDRFATRTYRELFPPTWQPVFVRQADGLKQTVESFWR